MDLGLAGMSGAELILKLKGTTGVENSLYVCVSGQGEDDVPWKDLGFDHYLQKPMGVDELDRILKVWAENG